MPLRLSALLLGALFCGGVACRTSTSVATVPVVGGDSLTASELAAALALTPPANLSDGSARGDTLARIAWLAYGDLEAGPDYGRGQRILRHAMRRGFDHTVISPGDLRWLVRCSQVDAAAWKEVAEGARRAGRGKAWASLLSAAADTTLTQGAHPRCPSRARSEVNFEVHH